MPPAIAAVGPSLQVTRPRQECLDTILPIVIFHDDRKILWRLDDEIAVDLAVKPETPRAIIAPAGPVAPAASTTAR
jgi:hypothetical protein